MIHINEEFQLGFAALDQVATKRITENLLPAGGSYGLEVTFAAIHEGLTRNNTFYSKEGLTNKEKNDQGQEGGLSSWTKPYAAPILKDHEPSANNQIGRVLEANWVEKGNGEKGHVEIKALITDPEAIAKFARGEFHTGSIGMDVDKAECSICGLDLKELSFFDPGCGHNRGSWYKKAAKGESEEDGPTWVKAEPREAGARRTHVKIGNVWAREYSVVATPSDAHSRVKTMKQVAIKSAVVKGEGMQEINLMTAPIKESVETPPQIEEIPEVKGHSIAELVHAVRGEMESDILTFYTRLCSGIVQGKEFTIGEIALTTEKLSEFSDYIEANNEDIEDELAEIAEAVLSTKNGATLPDSAYALVKTVEDKTIRTLRYKTESGLIDETNLRTSLSRWSQVEGWTSEEKAKAFRKLRAAAIKAGFGAEVPESIETELAEEIVQAKEFLSKQGLKVMTEDEIKALTTTPVVDTELKEKLEKSELDLREANQIIIERETEIEELVDDLEEAAVAAEAAVNEAVTKAAKVFATSLGIEDDKIEEAIKSKDSETGIAALINSRVGEMDEMMTVARTVGKTGLAIGSDGKEIDKTAPQLDTQTVLEAFFGSKKAKDKLFTETSKLR